MCLQSFLNPIFFAASLGQDVLEIFNLNMYFLNENKCRKMVVKFDTKT